VQPAVRPWQGFAGYTDRHRPGRGVHHLHRPRRRASWRARAGVGHLPLDGTHRGALAIIASRMREVSSGYGSCPDGSRRRRRTGRRPADNGGDVEQELGALIRRADQADREAADKLFAILYHELHRLAEDNLRRAGSSLTLGPTTLLHEAYLNIAGREETEFTDRARFMVYASRAMRGLVIDYARRRRAKKRGANSRSPLPLTSWR